MKNIFVSFVLIVSVLSVGSVVVAAKEINKGIKPSGSNPGTEVILGHRVNSQGQFVLVTR